jgi:predicted HTH domain antitoxin
VTTSETPENDHELRIRYGDDLLRALDKPIDEAEAEMRFFLAAKLFDLGKISSGTAAQLCGMRRAEFLVRLGSIGVSMIQVSNDDVARGDW